MNAPHEKRNPGGQAGASEGAQAGGLSAMQGYLTAPAAGLPRPKAGSICAKVLDALEAGRGLTAWDCWQEFGSSRLAVHVYALRSMGWPVVGEDIAVPARGGRVAHVTRYTLAKGGIGERHQ